MLLHKAHANWYYLIIAQLRPLYDSIPINLRTGSQAELGKKREPVSEANREGPGGEKWRESLFWCRLSLQPWVSRCARGTDLPTAERTSLATLKTDQLEASKLETKHSIDAALFFSYSSSITEHHFLSSRDMI